MNELYQFTIGTTEYHYTSSYHQITYDGDDYVPVTIGRSPIAATDDLNRSTVTVRAIRDLPYVAAALAAQDYGSLTMFAGNEEFSVVWKGRVIGITRSGAEAEITTESIVSMLAQMGIWAQYQYLCRHALYSEGCGLDPTSFEFAGNVSAIDGLDVTVPGLDGEADGYYRAGYIEAGAAGFRAIHRHIGNVITVLTAMPALEVGASVNIYPGCQHTLTACIEFANQENFGGFPFIPPEKKQPFRHSDTEWRS